VRKKRERKKREREKSQVKEGMEKMRINIMAWSSGPSESESFIAILAFLHKFTFQI